jgi:L-lysine exporter family protein LysE/ArgO
VTAFRDGFLLSLSLCLDLGIVNVGILRVAAQRGGTPAFLVGLGSGVGDLAYALLSVTGIALLLALPGVRWVLWLGGSAVLLFLAARMMREVFRPHPVAVDEPIPAEKLASPARDFAWGTALALASPSAILWFAAVGGSVIATYGGDRAVLLPFLCGFWVAGVLWSAGLAYGAGALRGVLGSRLVQGLSLASAALFAFFAAKVFLDGWRDLG